VVCGYIIGHLGQQLTLIVVIYNIIPAERESGRGKGKVRGERGREERENSRRGR